MPVNPSQRVDASGMDVVYNVPRVYADTLAGTDVGTGYYLGSGAATSISTAGNVTLTAAQLLTGIIVRDPNGAARTDTLPTAALLVAGVNAVSSGATVNDRIVCHIVNGADAAETITLAAGSGGGFDANQTAASRIIGQNTSKDIVIVLTNVTSGAEAYTVYA